MPIFDENDKGLNDLEGLPDSSVKRAYVKKEYKRPESPGPVKNIRILPTVLLVLVVSLGGATSFLANRLSNLSAEMNELKGIKAQLSAMQSKTDSGIDAASKERKELRTEISHLQDEIDAMKTRQRREAETARERQAEAEAKKKAPVAKKVHMKGKSI